MLQKSGYVVRHPTWSIVCLFLLASLSKSATFGTYTMSTQLGPQVTLSYKTDGTNAFFLIEKKAAGHVVFGIGNTMFDSDVVTITRAADNSAPVLKDCHLDARGAPNCGESAENWVLASSDSFELTATSMKVEIKRPLAASGQNKDKPIANGENTFIFSYTTNNLVVQHDSTGGYGTKTVNIAAMSATKSSQFLQQLSSVLFLVVTALSI